MVQAILCSCGLITEQTWLYQCHEGPVSSVRLQLKTLMGSFESPHEGERWDLVFVSVNSSMCLQGRQDSA